LVARETGRSISPELPAAEPIANNLKEDYFASIKVVRSRLDKIPFKEI